MAVLGQELGRLLRESELQLEWAVSLVPESMQRSSPPGMWSVARNLAHLAVYEEVIAAPTVRALAEGRDASTVTPQETEQSLSQREEVLSWQAVDAIMERLRMAREQQIEALGAFSDETLSAPERTAWGRTSAAWVLNKTFQHTWEHGNTILQIALFYPRSEGA